MDRKIVFTVLAVVIVGGLFFFLTQQKSSPQNNVPNPATVSKQKSDYKASFAIFTNSTFRVFTAAMYHNQSEDVFIQADNPNIVYVKKSGITWDDFFKTLPFKLSKDCLTTGTGELFCSGKNGTLKFYLNGERDDKLLDKVIHPNDRALITFGSEDESQIQKELQQVPQVQ